MLPKRIIRPVVRTQRVARFPRPVPQIAARQFTTTVEAPEPYKHQKSSTGLVGLDVVPHAREILIKMYDQYLKDLEQFEEGTPYRSHMTKLIQWRLDILNSTTDIFEIEEKISFQLEELIDQQEDEFALIPFLLEHKPWEPLGRFDEPFVLYSPIK